MKKPTKFTIYKVKEATELLEFLMKCKDGISRNAAKSLLAHRQVLVDNVITTQYNHALRPGMSVQISKEKGNKEFKSAFLKMLYEDPYIMVVDKKAGLKVTSTKPRERSVQDILNEYIDRSGKHRKVYPVTRVDKEASGLLIFAKDEKTCNNFNAAINEILKTVRFVAVLRGEMEKDAGVVASWMVEGKLYVSHAATSNRGGEKAITHYKTIKRANGYSLMELSLGEGFKNQLRSHAQILGHTMLGDERHDEGENPLERMALHCFKLAFRHPVTGNAMEFETPYPPEFRKLLFKG